MDKFDEKANCVVNDHGETIRFHSADERDLFEAGIAQALRDTAAEYWRKGQENMKGLISSWIGYRIQVVEGNDPKLNKSLSEWLSALPIEPVPEEV